MRIKKTALCAATIAYFTMLGANFGANAMVTQATNMGMLPVNKDTRADVMQLTAAVGDTNLPEPIATATPEPAPSEDVLEAEEVARVLYGMRYNDDDDLAAVVWCIINRVENAAYPNSVIEVCQQELQWIGYSSTNPVVDDLYDIASDVLTKWRSGGHRPFGAEFLWFSWTSEQITFRDKFEETKNCRYWRN